jgi:hypothetical protein
MNFAMSDKVNCLRHGDKHKAEELALLR